MNEFIFKYNLSAKAKPRDITLIERFDCRARNKKVSHRSMKEGKKIKYSASLNSLWFIVTELLGETCHTILESFVYGNALLVFLRRTPIWRSETNRNIWDSACNERDFFSLVS